jgi:ribosomal protein S14
MNKILRDIKRRKLSAKWEVKRLEYKYLLTSISFKPYKYSIQKKLDKLPINSSKTRIKNRCIFTGRSKAVYKDFKLSRIVFRELALSGQLPGIRKASW